MQINKRVVYLSKRYGQSYGAKVIAWEYVRYFGLFIGDGLAKLSVCNYTDRLGATGKRRG